MTLEQRETFKNDLKESLTIEQIYELLEELGGEPRIERNGQYIVSKTICHNELGEGSHKLYYYENTRLFRCYTSCNDVFDIFELIIKVYKIRNIEYTLPQAINFVAQYFGIVIQNNNFDEETIHLTKDWDILNKKLKRKNEKKDKSIVELKIYDKAILNYLPHPRIMPWEQDGIAKEVMELRGICYNPCSHGVVIPHYDLFNNLIGVRERTLIKENEIYGKYRPSILNNRMYNHALGFNLYNLNNSKQNISTIGKAIVFEGEKGCLQYASAFGVENDISVASCGSSFINYQFELLLSLGVTEIVIGYDKQFNKIGDEEWKKWTKKLREINNKYHTRCQLSFLFDKEDLLGYKMSPIDNGKEIFLKLFREREML